MAHGIHGPKQGDRGRYKIQKFSTGLDQKNLGPNQDKYSFGNRGPIRTHQSPAEGPWIPERLTF